MAISATTLKMKAPTKVDRAFWETSSEMTKEKERGVAVLLAEAKAATIDMLAEIIISKVFIETFFYVVHHAIKQPLNIYF